MSSLSNAAKLAGWNDWPASGCGEVEVSRQIAALDLILDSCARRYEEAWIEHEINAGAWSPEQLADFQRRISEAGGLMDELLQRRSNLKNQLQAQIPLDASF